MWSWSEESKKNYHKDYNKLYYIDNKEEVLKKQKIWYENNKEKVKEKQSQKIICECGCKISRGGISSHRETKKHEKLMLLKS